MELTEKLGDMATRHSASLPRYLFFALATLMAFRRKKNKLRYNLTEHVFIQAYIACQILLLSIIVLPFNGSAQVGDLYELPILFIFALFCLDYKQLYGYTWWRSFWTTVLMFFYSLILLIIFAIIVVALIVAAVYIIKFSLSIDMRELLFISGKNQFVSIIGDLQEPLPSILKRDKYSSYRN